VTASKAEKAVPEYAPLRVNSWVIPLNNSPLIPYKVAAEPSLEIYFMYS